MSVKEWYEPECDECGMYHCERLICEDCVKEAIRKSETKRTGDRK